MSFQPASRIVSGLREIVGPEYVRVDRESLDAYAADALGKGHLPDVVVLPANTKEI